MSAFGDNMKTDIYECFNEISFNWYEKRISEMNEQEKLKFLGDLFDVLHYMFGEW